MKRVDWEARARSIAAGERARRAMQLARNKRPTTCPDHDRPLPCDECADD